MRHAPLKFTLLSFGLHVLGLSTLWQHKDFESGIAESTGATRSVGSLVVAGIHSDKPVSTPKTVSDIAEKNEPSKGRLNHLAANLAQAALPGRNATGKENPRASLSGKDYLAAGDLTRLPSPVTSIDLDMDDVKELAAPGIVNLTILIDDDGTVADIFSSTENDMLQAFSERIMEIFRRARFSPGELNGVAVKARLEINIVSENVQSL